MLSDFALTLDPDAEIPLYHQIYREMRQAILTGRLQPGQSVPSTRSLAQILNLSRMTVVQAYDQLLGEGYLEARQGSGTFVGAQLPEGIGELPLPIPLSGANKSLGPLSGYGHHLAQTPGRNFARSGAEISFRYGSPALHLFPIERWRKLLSQACQDDRQWLDYSSDPQGNLGLRTAIAQYLSRVRAVRCTADRIVITNGTQHALDLLLQVLVEPGETIAAENPGYLTVRQKFWQQRLQMYPVSVDESGLMVDQLPHHRHPKGGACWDELDTNRAPLRLLYLTPSHQFPTGAVLPLTRRLELLQWAMRTETWLVEDDYDSEYRYGDRPLPALQGLDCGDRVLYIGSFSKVMFPSLRLGYLVLPQGLVHPVVQAKWLCDRQLPNLEQIALANFIEAGYLESHIRKMRRYYDQNRKVLVQALNETFGTTVRILGDQAGLHVMTQFDLPMGGDEMVRRGRSVGVELVSALPYYLEGGSDREFIFGYGELTAEQIKEGVDRLAVAFQDDELSLQ
jgi:GntR family transcriptional regulator / MocR family aminotransferase